MRTRHKSLKKIPVVTSGRGSFSYTPPPNANKNLQNESSMAAVLDTAIEVLQDNFVFNSSLGNKELFHSNLFGMLLMQNDSWEPLLKDVSQLLSQVFTPKNREKGLPVNKYHVISFFREFHKFDLFIAYLDEDSYKQISELKIGNELFSSLRDAAETLVLKNLKDCDDYQQWKVALQILKKNCQFVVVENKFKSLPDKVQLFEYYGKVLRKIPFVAADRNSVKISKDNTTFYLLNAYLPKKEYPNIAPPWKQVFYADIVNRTDDLVDANLKSGDSFAAQYLKKYCEMQRFHLWLGLEITNSIRMHKSVFPDELFIEKLKKIRVSDFYEKMWFSKLACLFGINEADCGIKKGAVDFVTEIGYTNGHGLLGYKCLLRDRSHIAYGVQIQNRQFRFYVEPLPTKYHRVVENFEDAPHHLSGSSKKSYVWANFDEKKFLSVLAKVKREALRELKFAGVEEDFKQGLCKFGDFKYVYAKLSKSITQKQLSNLIKVALSKLGDMVQKNRKLFGVKPKKEV